MARFSPIISVLIPLYNKANLIERAVSAVIAQNIDDMEILIVDDGSTDGGRAIVKKIKDHRIRILCQENQGVSAARNRGIEEAKSDLIAFLDADDEWKPGFLKTILSLRKKYPDAGAYGTSYQILLRSGKIYHPKFMGIPKGWEGILPSYFRASFGMHVFNSSSVAIPKNVFKEIGGFPVGEKLGEDLDMWLRIAIRFPIAYYNNEFAVYHQEADNRTDSSPISLDTLPYLKSAQHALDSGVVPQRLRNDMIEYVATRKIGYAKRFIKLGETEVGRKILKEIETERFIIKKFRWMILSFLPKQFFNILRRGKWKLYQLSSS